MVAKKEISYQGLMKEMMAQRGGKTSAQVMKAVGATWRQVKGGGHPKYVALARGKTGGAGSKKGKTGGAGSKKGGGVHELLHGAANFVGRAHGTARKSMGRGAPLSAEEHDQHNAAMDEIDAEFRRAREGGGEEEQERKTGTMEREQNAYGGANENSYEDAMLAAFMGGKRRTRKRGTRKRTRRTRKRSTRKRTRRTRKRTRCARRRSTRKREGAGGWWSRRRNGSPVSGSPTSGSPTSESPRSVADQLEKSEMKLKQGRATAAVGTALSQVLFHRTAMRPDTQAAISASVRGGVQDAEGRPAQGLAAAVGHDGAAVYRHHFVRAVHGLAEALAQAGRGSSDADIAGALNKARQEEQTRREKRLKEIPAELQELKEQHEATLRSLEVTLDNAKRQASEEYEERRGKLEREQQEAEAPWEDEDFTAADIGRALGRTTSDSALAPPTAGSALAPPTTGSALDSAAGGGGSGGRRGRRTRRTGKGRRRTRKGRRRTRKRRTRKGQKGGGSAPALNAQQYNAVPDAMALERAATGCYASCADGNCTQQMETQIGHVNNTLSDLATAGPSQMEVQSEIARTKGVCGTQDCC